MDVTTVEVASDYCDACPAEAHVQAFLYASHPDWAASIAYCGHHAAEYVDELARVGATIIDRRHELHP